MRAELAVRDAPVRTRTRCIALAKALVQRDGLHVPTSASSWVPTRIAQLDLSPTLTTELAPPLSYSLPASPYEHRPLAARHAKRRDGGALLTVGSRAPRFPNRLSITAYSSLGLGTSRS